MSASSKPELRVLSAAEVERARRNARRPMIIAIKPMEDGFCAASDPRLTEFFLSTPGHVLSPHVLRDVLMHTVWRMVLDLQESYHPEALVVRLIEPVQQVEVVTN